MRRHILIPAPPANWRCRLALHEWGYSYVTGIKARGPFRRICTRCRRYEEQGDASPPASLSGPAGPDDYAWFARHGIVYYETNTDFRPH